MGGGHNSRAVNLMMVSVLYLTSFLVTHFVLFILKLGGFSTIKSTRTKGRVAQLQTPGGFASEISMITPKFDPATPLSRTAMRTQKADEKFLVSMNGSPVYVGGRGNSRAKNDNLIPVPIGGGSTMMVPTDDPSVQPIIQKLIKNCMNMMTKN